jgi:hypothetical protein
MKSATWPAKADRPGIPGTAESSRLIRLAILGGLTIILAIGVTLGAVELSLRVFAPQPTKRSVPALLDHDLIYRLPSNAEGTDVKAEFAVSIRTNALGLRDRDYPMQKGANVVRRIMILGDSMTWGEGVEGEMTYPNILETALGDRVEIINAAVRGYGTDQELKLFEQLVPLYRPDIAVLAVFPLNDYDDNLYGHLFEVKDGRLKRLTPTAATSPKYRYYMRQSAVQNSPGYAFLIEHSHLANFVRRRWAWREFHANFHAESEIDRTHEVEAWELMWHLLDAWVAAAEEQHVKPMVLLIPSRKQIYEGSEEPTDSRTARLVAYAQDRGLILLDPRAALRTAARQSVVLYYPLDQHLTKEGHQVVADYLRASLSRLEMVPSPGVRSRL